MFMPGENGERLAPLFLITKSDPFDNGEIDQLAVSWSGTRDRNKLYANHPPAVVYF
ncbi:hypothetical protein KTT_52740 [Tengunoibacter tsumagoiensis]|uniref:Uncharacterized protein n=1 Tax=Tengunoibacter tsumagoiensis TaxID=2014871 RepID=A0A402A8W9_9CHLR|nr:hypothetical protein KTT_52740 [Tengunoibacter tsumagoiensis]